MKRTTLYWLIPLFIILLGLTACERPVQDSVLPATATPGAPILGATQPPLTGASPTPPPIRSHRRPQRPGRGQRDADD